MLPLAERSYTYQFDVDMADGKPVGVNADRLLRLKKRLKGTGYRAKIVGRGPRRGVRQYSSMLPLGYATWASIYIYPTKPDWSATDWRSKFEAEKNFCLKMRETV